MSERKTDLDALRHYWTVRCVGGFSCMEPGVKDLHKERDRGFYVLCKEGRHYLDGQIDDDGSLLGFTLESEGMKVPGHERVWAQVSGFHS